MTNNINLPVEILAYTFSFLEPEELARIARVSKEWNEVQKIEELWKRHCLDRLKNLNNVEPYQNSWKEHFKITNNWMHAKAEKNSFSSYCKDWDQSHGFTVLEDNTPLEVYSENAMSYAIRDFLTDQITPIDQYFQDMIVCSTIHNKTWVALTNHGEILFFDLLTGKYLNKITPSEEHMNLSRAKIKCTDQEVITAYNKEIKIWDINTGLLKETINLPELGEILTLTSTPNFFICTTYTGKFNTFSIRKRDHEISKMENLFFPSAGIADSDPYVAIIYQEEKDGKTINKIKIFEDTGEKLNLLHTLETFNPQTTAYSGSVYIHKNWLLASKDGKLNVYDIKTGKTLLTIQHNKISVAFCSNTTQLFMQTALGNPFGEQEYQYTLYNFERPITNLNAPKKFIIQ
ncbi:MAG TPA: F-box/WD40 repeat-containing protein [Rhabdochlamydiaceae bacterium]|nr:F-box/WD40 repeat-containing protein [Rhabdochlamydiaceae bacterium]